MEDDFPPVLCEAPVSVPDLTPILQFEDGVSPERIIESENAIRFFRGFINFALSEEQKRIRKAPRKLTSDHVAPFDAQMNRENHIDKDILRKMIQQELRGLIGEGTPEVLRLLVARELLR